MADTKPFVPLVKPLMVPVKPIENPFRKLLVPDSVKKELVVPEKESDAVLKKMFVILDRSTDFSPNSEYSILRKKYEELKGQGK